MNSRSLSRGVSLIEALVALAVMAFGLLGVVGMQATLRYNADISKQRSEAVRMAQQQVEDLRAFGTLAGTAEWDYADIASVATATVPTPAGFANTTFNITTTVANPVATDAQFKTVAVSVDWLDRRTDGSGTAQSVKLTTAIAAVAPALGATLGLPGDRAAPQRPRGRHPTIPPAAVDLGGGTSSFAPPGAPSGTSWTFVNATGQITQVCTPTCTTLKGWLLSGYIVFATGAAPTPAEAESPSDAKPLSHIVSVDVTAATTPAPASSPVCFASTSTLSVNYFCLVPTKPSNSTWSGRSVLGIFDISTSATSIAGLLSDTASSNFKVCRYTPEASHTPTGGNAAHPLDYTDVGGSLINQNFLVITAGSGTAAFGCPGDDTGTPLVNGNTFAHQPIS